MNRQDQQLYQDVGRVIGLLEGLDSKVSVLHRDLKDHMVAEDARMGGLERRVDQNELALNTLGAKVTVISTLIVAAASTGMDWVKKHILHL